MQAAQQPLAVVPLDGIWIPADFRETQLRRCIAGSLSQFMLIPPGATIRAMSRGCRARPSNSSLLPPENATGNYVKVVQRLPVRIRLYLGEDPDHRLRPAMSVEPTV